MHKAVLRSRTVPRGLSLCASTGTRYASATSTSTERGVGVPASAYMDYAHPDQPGARARKYIDPLKDWGWQFSGPFFERPHLRRYIDAWQAEGKVFEATEELLPAQQTIKMFHIPADLTRNAATGSEEDVNHVLEHAHSKVRLVTLNFSGVGLPNQDMSAWHSAYLSAFPEAEDPKSEGFAMTHVKYMDGMEYRFFPDYFTTSNAAALPEKVKPSAFVVFEPLHYNVTLLTELAGMHNRAFGFAYLVDAAGQIRWRAHGLPTGSELSALVSAAKKIAQE